MNNCVSEKESTGVCLSQESWGAWQGHGLWCSAAAPWPDLPASLPSPHPVWFYCGVVGSFLFLLIQLVLVVDFAHSWNQQWLGKAEERDSRAWYAGQCHGPALRRAGAA